MFKKINYFLILLVFVTSVRAFSISVSSGDEAYNLTKEYFVVLKEQPLTQETRVKLSQKNLLLSKIEKKIISLGGSVIENYHFAFIGSFVRLNLEAVAILKKDPLVKMVVENGEAFLDESSLSARSWGLDRIDQKDLPLDNSYIPRYRGGNSHVYIIDSGVRQTHQEFKNRIRNGYTAINDNSSPYDDCNGHGTHVAGTVAGNSAGVAKGAKIHSVKVFGCSGGTSWNTIINAINWVIENHFKPAVANMSLGGSYNEAINLAVTNATKAGVHMVVSAGNDAGHACLKSPASTPEAVTVAASDITDKLASFSNFGECVDIIAPGVAILSASHQSDDTYRSLSGTSMSAPHITGAIATSLQAYPKMKTEEMANLLVSHANVDKISDPKGSPNVLLYITEIGSLPYVNTNIDYQVIRYPRKHSNVLGTAYDPDGKIKTAFWSQIEGPIAASFIEWKQRLIITNMELGTYTFRYEAVNDKGLSNHKDVKIYVTDRNLLPISNAGKDFFVPFLGSKVLLDGSKSYDLDGTIESYQWKQISGEKTVSFVQPNKVQTEIKNFGPGVYRFELKVTDDKGESATDTVEITFNAHPTVEVGEDQIITLPVNQVTVEGTASDSDGTIVRYFWYQVSGPSTANIINRNLSKTDIKNLKEGVYQFRLAAYDNHGAANTDQIKITVNTAEAP